jgi:hypothetical protein
MQPATDLGSQARATPSPSRPLSPPPFKSIRLWGGVLAALIGSVGFGMIFALDFLAGDLYTLRYVVVGEPVSGTEIAVNHARMHGLGVGLVVAGLAAAAVWLAWQYQVHANARALNVPRVHVRPWAGVLLWLIPGVNLLGPPLAISEVWGASNPDTPDRQAMGRRFSVLVWAWWLAFVGVLVLVWWSYRGTVEPNVPPAALKVRDHRLVITALAGLPTSVLAIFLVRSISYRLFLKEDRVRVPEWRTWAKD